MAFRKSILRLVSKISIESGTYLGITPNDPEYKAFDPVVTDEMAEVCMGCKLRTPRTTEEIAASVDVLEQKGMLLLLIIGVLVLALGYRRGSEQRNAFRGPAPVGA